MCAELLKNEREVKKTDDGKYIFVLSQEQLYDKEARDNMVNGWKKELEDKENWIKNKDQFLEQGINEVKMQFDKMEEQITKDVESLKEAIEIWEKA